jgi:periplasmic protein TonB
VAEFRGSTPPLIGCNISVARRPALDRAQRGKMRKPVRVLLGGITLAGFGLVHSLAVSAAGFPQTSTTPEKPVETVKGPARALSSDERKALSRELKRASEFSIKVSALVDSSGAPAPVSIFETRIRAVHRAPSSPADPGFAPANDYAIEGKFLLHSETDHGVARMEFRFANAGNVFLIAPPFQGSNKTFHWQIPLMLVTGDPAHLEVGVSDVRFQNGDVWVPSPSPVSVATTSSTPKPAASAQVGTSAAPGPLATPSNGSKLPAPKSAATASDGASPASNPASARSNPAPAGNASTAATGSNSPPAASNALPAASNAAPSAPPAPSNASPTTPRRGVAGRVDRVPRALNRPRPNYTEEARKNGINGVVRARLLVDKEGAPKTVTVLSFLPDGLTEQAILAIKEMRFTPALRSGEPVAYAVTLEVEFNLR